MKRKTPSMAPMSSMDNDTINVDTRGAADPAFGINTGSPGVNGAGGGFRVHGAVCAKCGSGYCGCVDDGKEEGGW